MENEIMNNTELENNEDIIVTDEAENEGDSKLGVGIAVLVGAGLVAGGILVGRFAKRAWQKIKDKKEASKQAESEDDDETEEDSEG
jgi:hypothetical protein